MPRGLLARRVTTREPCRVTRFFLAPLLLSLLALPLLAACDNRPVYPLDPEDAADGASATDAAAPSDAGKNDG